MSENLQPCMVFKAHFSEEEKMKQFGNCSKSEAKEWRQESSPGLSGFPVLQFPQLSDRAARP